MRYRQSSTPREQRPDEYGVRKAEIIKYAAIAVGLVVVVALLFVWFVCRVDVPAEHFVTLVKKTGGEMTNKMILAPSDEIKGPQFAILKEGRHFRNPYHWGWTRPTRATVIPNEKVGILIRRHGEPLALGQVIAGTEKQKGIVAAPLKPGRYYINPWEYDVELYDTVIIRIGHVGVVTLLVGREPKDANVFVVAEGERGTQPTPLGPARYAHYSNPYVHMVTEIDVRSQKFEMSGEYGVTFPSKFGFDIHVEGTIEWAPTLEKLPELFVKYVDETDLRESGGINNLRRKIILPFARSYFRTVGGRFRAVDYITGDTRIKVQNEVQRRLRESCAKEGIDIRSFVIRATKPPEQIRDQYMRRETARLETDRYQQEIITEIGAVVLEGAKPKLDEKAAPVLDERGRPVMVGKEKIGDDGKVVREGGRLAKIIEVRRKDRQTRLGGVRSRVAEAVREAERYQAVEVTKALRELEVAKIHLEAAKDTAAKILAEGTAQAEVTVMKNKAEAQAVKAKITAFGLGEKYAEYQLITKISPGIQRVLSNTEGLFATLFERFASMSPARPSSGKAKK